jgi:hypothetical protein
MSVFYNKVERENPMNPVIQKAELIYSKTIVS